MDNNNLTNFINSQNIQNVREQIALKNTTVPYYATYGQASQVLTDYDSFPYTRWYRGVPTDPNPVIIEREAGWRPLNNKCYTVNTPVIRDPKPDHCFETACNVVKPCINKLNRRFNNKTIKNEALNDNCVISNR